MGVYLYTEEQEWQPGENTIAYYPLDSVNTVNDLSGNNNNLTNNGSVTFNSLGAVTGSGKWLSGSNFTGMPTGNSNRTYSVWFNMASIIGTVNYVYAFGSFSNLQLVSYAIYSNNTYVDYWNRNLTVGSAMPTNTWKNAVFTNDNGTQTLYIDGVKIGTTTQTLNTTNNLLLGKGDRYYFDGQISNVIVEDKAWIEQEVTDYYNLTKGNYGL